MIEITRSEAEELFRLHSVRSSRLEQNPNELCVYIQFDGAPSFIVKYDLKRHRKSYYLEGNDLQNEVKPPFGFLNGC
ncbi:MAG: hypothetical protein ONB12_13955 [candidate division KSB1 bacterium]|nr:hypothetical protein [candidate division KSB1 bacterium]